MPQPNQPLALPHGTSATAGLNVGDVKAAVLGYDKNGNPTLSILTSNGWIDIRPTDENIVYLDSIGITPHVAAGVAADPEDLPSSAADDGPD